MSSATNDGLEEINRKLQIIIENAFLSRLDMMFSILVSLTIFLLSLMLNNALSQKGLFSITFFVGLLFLFVTTIIGEFYAIIRDDVVGRFRFWIALGFNFVTLVFLVLALISSKVFPSIYPSFIILSFYIYIIFKPFLNKVGDLFDKYIKRFPSRINDVSGIVWSRMYLLLGAENICVSILVLAFFLVFGV